MDLISPIVKFIGKINWSKLIKYKLNSVQHEQIKEILKEHHCIILTRRNTHLSTYGIALANLIKYGKLSYWSHALINIEGDKINNIDDFKLLEATSDGVHFSKFMDVFDCDSTVLLIPNGFTPADWTKFLARARGCIGKDYDTLFDIWNPEKMSCIEVVFYALLGLEDFNARFPKLLKSIEKSRNITPQSLYDSGEFYAIYEVRDGRTCVGGLR